MNEFDTDFQESIKIAALAAYNQQTAAERALLPQPKTEVQLERERLVELAIYVGDKALNVLPANVSVEQQPPYGRWHKRDGNTLSRNGWLMSYIETGSADMSSWETSYSHQIVARILGVDGVMYNYGGVASESTKSRLVIPHGTIWEKPFTVEPWVSTGGNVQNETMWDLKKYELQLANVALQIPGFAK